MTNPIEYDELNIERKFKDFSELLSKIESISDKKRQLWLEIYQNAITDRQNAYAIFMNLVKIVQAKSTEYAIHGKTITASIERMSKSNDQLIKLADLIARAEQSSESIDPEEMFRQINN